MMKTDSLLPPEKPTWMLALFSFVILVTLYNYKHFQGFVSLQISFQSTDADVHIVCAIM